MNPVIDIADKFPIRFDTQRMLGETAQFQDGAWLEHYDVSLTRDWKAIPLISLDGRLGDAEAQRAGTIDQYKPTLMLDKMPYFKEVLSAFKCPLGRVRILKLAPGAKIGEHRDVGLEVANLAFNRVRLHVPIKTNPGVIFYVGGERFHMAEGGLYYANFSHLHRVVNEGQTERVHLVIDAEVNDWLWEFFPKPTLVDRAGFLAQRTYLPVFWKMRRMQTVARQKAWRSWDGSAPQQFWRTLRGQRG
jgi:hypothetical protein